jgi:fucose permease
MLACVVASRNWSIVFLMLSGLSFGLSTSNFWAITQRLAGPQAVGRWCGLQLFVGNSSGAVVAAVTGFVLDRTGHFFWPFLIVSLFLWIGALGWIFIVGPIEPVEWEKTVTCMPTEQVAYSD